MVQTTHALHGPHSEWRSLLLYAALCARLVIQSSRPQRVGERVDPPGASEAGGPDRRSLAGHGALTTPGPGGGMLAA